MITRIKNGTVIDPASGTHEVRDLWIDADRITAPSDHADSVIDATGQVVCPGFIDIHMHEDPVGADGNLESYDERSVFACMLHMGVTTAVAGNCGENKYHPADYLDLVDRDGTPVNVAMLAGHGFFRHEAGCNNRYISATAAQRDRMAGEIREALQRGCVGVSYGLRYEPGMDARELVETAGGYKKASAEALNRSVPAEGILRQAPPETQTSYPRDPHQALDDPYTICCGSTVESTVVDFADDPAATCVYRAWRKPCTNPYVPLFIGNLKVPSSYAWMRRELADATHFDPPAEEFVYDPSTAFWNYENLIWQSELDYGFAHSVFGPDIERIEADWEAEVAQARAKYEELKADDPQLAKAFLSEFSDGKARFSLHWTQRTVQRIGKKKYLINQNVPE